MILVNLGPCVEAHPGPGQRGAGEPGEEGGYDAAGQVLQARGWEPGTVHCTYITKQYCTI